MKPLFTALLLALASPLACGPKKPVTDWYYSSWISMDGVAAEASFDEARKTCLARSGVREPAAVEPGSEKEQEFIECMKTARWCTPARGCD